MLNLRSAAQISLMTLSIFMLTGLNPGYANDEQRYYDIEIVLFQNSAALKDLPELQSAAQPLSLPERFIQLGMPTTPEDTGFVPEFYFTQLPESEFKLNEAAAKIEKSRSYRILKHIAWRQPGLAREVAIPIVFHDEIAAEIPEAIPGSEEQPPLLYTQAKLDAVFTVSLSRYLHLETELRFEASGLAPAPEANPEALAADQIPTVKPRPTSVVYIEKQRRRMRSKELHYIDHPVIGMLVIMTPVEIPQTQQLPAKVTR